MPFFHSMVFY